MMEILNFSQNATDLEVFQQENVLKVLIWLKRLSVSMTRFCEILEKL